MTRLRAIYTYIILSVGQIVGCVVFLLVYWMPWFQVLFHYTDNIDFGGEIIEHEIYPNVDGFFCLADGAILCAFFLAIPLMILMLGRIVKYLMHQTE